MKTMTVNEIILALECCVQPYSICEGCPFYDDDYCRDKLKLAIIDKLDCQKAEIENRRKKILNYEREAELAWEREVMRNDR